MVDGAIYTQGRSAAIWTPYNYMLYCKVDVYVRIYLHAVGVPMRLTGGTLVLYALCSANCITPYKNNISLYSILIYIHTHKQCLGSYSYAVNIVVV